MNAVIILINPLLLIYTKEVVDDMVMSDVKEEEVVIRITKMAAELHFSGDRSSISGMKVPAEVTNWSWRTWMTTKRS